MLEYLKNYVRFKEFDLMKVGTPLFFFHQYAVFGICVKKSKNKVLITDRIWADSCQDQWVTDYQSGDIKDEYEFGLYNSVPIFIKKQMKVL